MRKHRYGVAHTLTGRYVNGEVNIQNIRLLKHPFLMLAAAMISMIVQRKVFFGFELIVVTAVVSLCVGFIVHKRRSASEMYYIPVDKRNFFQRQGPSVYLFVILSIVGLISLHTSVGQSFKTTTQVLNKTTESVYRGGTRYVLSVDHELYGHLGFYVSKKFWLSQQEGNEVILKVRKNYLDMYVIVDYC
ncbi:hypothetical protein [Vibrio gallaecicus]|uniref:hypothetical protein n=2 Tax=Vibrio gallaecicus TaxID=552386 RepID=UPI0025B34D53|nr:hypothetical protein [Vibrio gallaecicus]MDN3617178.1 hypothetical protein [Vibrio gallaecicus]